MLDDQEDIVRSRVAMALGEIGNPRAVEPLVAALKDGDKEVRRGAISALDNLGWFPDNAKTALCTGLSKVKMRWRLLQGSGPRTMASWYCQGLAEGQVVAGEASDPGLPGVLHDQSNGGPQWEFSGHPT